MNTSRIKKAAKTFAMTLGFIGICIAITGCIGVVIISSLNYLRSIGFGVFESVMISGGGYSLLIALFAAFLAYRQSK
jgi:hypothetical protein